MSKQELIDRIVHLLLTEFEPYSVSAADRAFLEKSTVAYLESKLRELRDEAVEKLEEEHTVQLAQIRAERIANQLWFQFQSQKETEPRRKAEEKAQLEQDQKTFNNAAKALRQFAVNQANFNVIRQTLGSDFTLSSIQVFGTIGPFCSVLRDRGEIESCWRLCSHSDSILSPLIMWMNAV